MQIEVTVNGKPAVWEVDNDAMLAETLRTHGFLSVRKGCDTSCCGLCTVWLDGKPVLSCTVLSFRAQGRQITTIEGLQPQAEEFARILAAEGAEQCGYCSPGFIMTVLALKQEISNPSEADIIHYLTGNLCRCTGYLGQMRAIKKYLGVA
ncbi:(2Fe-2S)-binding protein [Acetonema longum]|uniref:2Fe-2S iron-sulfur cluster binding domain-containing protein n=1 Tax=Acetonema longum DSM 6540 TaxID=1009370 RepID=F7NJ06_9FIRM|nr:(2Fe-2S)-binding protein [Acetonema longum]EGO64003.1 2Fe-2S iron-sulfur cluster binding domain-containing protein [Acetonema longum DSM 6540]